VFATVNGVRLFFDVLNPQLEIVPGGLREKPILICLHGGPGGDHQAMRPGFDRLGSVAQVVYLDQRGGGRSERGSPDSWTLDQWADDVAAFCEAIGADRPILLGQSGGAMVAQAFLARHPDRAAGAVLLNACARLDREALIARWDRVGPEAGAAARAMYTDGDPKDVPAFFQHCLPHYVRRPPPADPDAAARTSFNFAVTQRFFREGGEAWRFDHRVALGQVACPVLLLVGAHDPITWPEWGREVCEALPPRIGELQVFQDSSHGIPTDEPEAMFGAIERFVARISAG
jgi:pimeloyl-ACP methyl ester carboxylesterase